MKNAFSGALSFKKRHRALAFLLALPFRGSSFLAKKLSRAIIPRPKNAVWLELPSGLRFFIDPLRDSAIEPLMYFLGSYETGTLALIEDILEPGQTFFDVGANIGLMTAVAARAVGPRGHVVAFEPVAQTAQILRMNLAANGLEDRAQVAQVALGAENDSKNVFYRWDLGRGAATLIEHEGEAPGEKVETIRLDSFLKAQKIWPDAIKMDIEGYEIEALAGAGPELFRDEKTAPAMIIESCDHFSSEHPAQLLAFLQGLGCYRIFKFRRGKWWAYGLKEVKTKNDLPCEFENLVCLAPRHLASKRLTSWLPSR